MAITKVTTGIVVDDAITADKLANSINTEIAANTAKVTNTTHTGDVTGATALTIAADAVDIAMLSATGTASSSTFLRGDNAWAAGGLFSSYAIIADQKAQSTNGGTYTNGDWRTHDLQTEIADPDGIVSISSNQFTLAAGTYFIKWLMVLGQVIYCKTRLYNITDSAESQIGMTGDGRAGTNLTGFARVTIAGSKAFEIQLKGTNTVASTGFGFASLFATEQYCTVEIFKEA